MNKELCGIINRDVDEGRTLSTIPASDWAQFIEWAQWMKLPTPKQDVVLEHHILKIEVECARRGVTF